MPPTIEKLMKQSAEGHDVSSHLQDLKRAVLLDGIETDESGMSPHRVYIWLILLQAPLMPYSEYGALLARGASPAYSKINDDVHRTLATDPLFLRRVSQNSISRILNSIAWAMYDRTQASTSKSKITTTTTTKSKPTETPSPSAQRKPSTPPASAPEPENIPLPPSPSLGRRPSPYVQGMNVLAAPLLYVSRSEPQAYTLLHSLLTREIPSYVTPTMPGVHAGLTLLDKCLSILDPPLYNHLTSKSLSAASYAFPSVATLSACTPPLPEVIRLWDFLFAYGPHLNVLAVVAQLVLMRDRLLGSVSPGKELRSFPGLRARRVVDMVVAFVGRLEGGREGRAVYKELVRHTHVK
ncbi:MAG: hypothetical protein MMC23_005624 [Stictis urceolatum]|nr:hypothetical protein [Stictis urceolata]